MAGPAAQGLPKDYGIMALLAGSQSHPDGTYSVSFWLSRMYPPYLSAVFSPFVSFGKKNVASRQSK